MLVNHDISAILHSFPPMNDLQNLQKMAEAEAKHDFTF